EHPPLIKWWIGAWLPLDTFELPPLRALKDKGGERAYVNEAVYVSNDPDRVQTRARVAMLVLHGLLVALLAWCLRRAFSPAVALSATGLLLLDPTIAANLPLVMTDLAMALLATCSVLLCYRAFTLFQPRDFLLTTVVLGLTLLTKHSSLVAVFAVMAVAVVQIVRSRSQLTSKQLSLRAAALFGVLLGAYIGIWAGYAFRFREDTPATAHIGWSTADNTRLASAAASSAEVLHFNRALHDKFSDLRSETMPKVLEFAAHWQLLPRSYLWGLADTMRTGLDGRYETLYVFGHYIAGNRTPWYFFPAIMVAKLPLGVLALALLGVWMVLRKRMPKEWLGPLTAVVTLAVFHLLLLMRGHSGFAGIRHSLPAVPAILLLASLPCVFAFSRHTHSENAVQRSLTLRGLAAALIAVTALTVLPVTRPWEYYNELVGGAANSWRYFTDDGVDMRQRTRDLAQYYDKHVRGTREAVYELYDMAREESQTRGLTLRSLDSEPLDSQVVSGTLFVNARWLQWRPLYDLAALREAEPIARMGNLMVFRGEYKLPWLPADRRRVQAWNALATEPPDTKRAEQLFAEVVALYPEDYGSALELGNLRMERGDQHAALAAYSHALAQLSASDSLRDTLSKRVAALRESDGLALRPIRNPWLE
ncbi:MAG: hypothetical protein RL701_6479, partial [Pseudomonadota bacterium]